MVRTARAYIVAGMAYGDEGKGLTTDYLTRRHRAGLVVRYNGGPQAAHNVIAANPDGSRTHHVFSQFGSGTLAGARTHLSRFMLIDPLALELEASVLESKIGTLPDPRALLSIDPDCVIITPSHQIANQYRELLRGKAAHGSVGLGVGEARGDALAYVALCVRDVLAGPSRALAKLEEIRDRKVAQLGPTHDVSREELARLADRYAEILRRYKVCALGELYSATHGVTVFEGAQGVLLDERHGIAPHNTWTNCTFENAETLLDEIGVGERERVKIGVYRSYFTRHGAGPFATEDAAIDFPDHNCEHLWAGKFRQGHFDLRMACFACRADVARPDELMVTHMDYAARVGAEGLPEILEREGSGVGVPVTMTSWGPTAADVRERSGGKTLDRSLSAA